MVQITKDKDKDKDKYKVSFITYALALFIVMAFILLGSSCSVIAKKQNIIPELTVGNGTDKFNEIWITEIIFDDTWRSAKGNLSCCWGRRGGGQGFDNVIAPKKLNVSWVDIEPERFFRAELTLSDKLYDYTKNLPNYYIASNMREMSGIIPELIVGLGSAGEVVVWISNSAYARNTAGRVMYEVGRGQAVCLPSQNEGVPDNCKNLANEAKIIRPF